MTHDYRAAAKLLRDSGAAQALAVSTRFDAAMLAEAMKLDRGGFQVEDGTEVFTPGPRQLVIDVAATRRVMLRKERDARAAAGLTPVRDPRHCQRLVISPVPVSRPFTAWSDVQITDALAEVEGFLTIAQARTPA